MLRRRYQAPLKASSIFLALLLSVNPLAALAQVSGQDSPDHDGPSAARPAAALPLAAPKVAALPLAASPALVLPAAAPTTLGFSTPQPALSLPATARTASLPLAASPALVLPAAAPTALGLPSAAHSAIAPMVAAGPSPDPAPSPTPQTQSLDPITIQSTDKLRRDVENLATKCGLVLPGGPTPMTRSDLGRFFLEMLPKLSSLPPDALATRDLQDIGRLSDEFENSLQEIKGTILLKAYKNNVNQVKEIDAKVEEARSRLAVLEKVKVNGDFTFAPQQDWGKTDADSMTANLRARLNFLCKVHEAKPEAKLGDGYVFCRLTAAAGRFFPRNKYLMSPLNDIVDANASPFNSGPNEVQLSNLVINNNNSNSLRPTMSLEQAYYSQDFKPFSNVKGNFKTGLIYLGAMFDNNNFANNEALQFMNTQFVNSISWRPNFNGPAVVMSLEKPLFRGKAFVRGTSAMATISNRDFFGANGFNQELQLGHAFFNKEGNFRVGFWNWNFRAGSPKAFTTPPDISGTSLLSLIPGGVGINSPKPVGMYLNFDQKIWKDLGIWGRYACNDKNIGEVLLGGLLSSRGSWSVGTELPMKSLPFIKKRRPDDVLGIAYGQVLPYSRNGIASPATPAFLSLGGVPATNIDEVEKNLSIINPGRARRVEKCLEVYYRYQLNKNISISPDIQYIWSPGATGPQPGIFALGTRLNCVF